MNNHCLIDATYLFKQGADVSIVMKNYGMLCTHEN